MRIRPANESDLGAILAIFNHEILTSTVIYLDVAQTLEERQRWFADKKASGAPVFVLEDDDGVAGFGTYGMFRNFCGYRYCVEHSIYVATNKRRLGYGRQLLAAVIDAATGQGMHTMIAAIDAENESSIRLHLAFGFVSVGHFREVGAKFNRWLDVVFLQKILDDRSAPTSP